MKKSSVFDQWAQRAIAEELGEAAGTSLRDSRPHHGICWLCKSHTRYGSHVIEACSRKGCKCRSQESPLLSSMGGTEYVCVRDQRLASCPRPLSHCSTFLQAVQAKGPKQNHLSCPKQAEPGMQGIVWSRMTHTCSLHQHPQQHLARASAAL